MRAVVQRVLHARVTVSGDGGDDVETGAIEGGLLVYLAVAPADTAVEADWMARKVAELRLFVGDGGFLDRSVQEAGGAVLLVSQFTLYADTRRGRRPDFTAAAPPDLAAPLVEAVAAVLRARGLRVAEGRFGAHMRVDSANDGPVTILLDSADRDRPRRG
ncbi:MAG: D-tyrosyl-tRNA(Tyr) deacylase [Dehalococcoidia bacterium]|nr:D-tyrosyl-tRNA(Tyr) deacylase [Dehalococcoidia bacterium]